MADSRSFGRETVDGDGVAGVTYRLGRLVTVRQLAERLGVPMRTVRDWVYRRRVPFTKLCGRVYFSEDVVEGLMAANAVAPSPSCGPQASVERKEMRHAGRIAHE